MEGAGDRCSLTSPIIDNIFGKNSPRFQELDHMSKRKQVKNACGKTIFLRFIPYFSVNCQKACKKCDDSRPCERCRKYGLDDSCRDSARKERKRGSRRGPYSKGLEGGESDDSDGLSSSRWSDDYKSEEAAFRDSPKPANFRLKFEENRGNSNSDQYWNMSSRSVQAKERPVRAARSKAVKYVEETNFGSVSPVGKPLVRVPLQVGAADSSYIKALGAVCTEVLRKIEEEDMPPAVSFSEWPPKIDQHFVPVSFIEQTRQANTIPLLQPIPIPKLALPLAFEKDFDDQHISVPSGYCTSSSPMSFGSNGMLTTMNQEIMTPPETPISISPSHALHKSDSLFSDTIGNFSLISPVPLSNSDNHPSIDQS